MEYKIVQSPETLETQDKTLLHYVNIISSIVATYQLLFVQPLNVLPEQISGAFLASTLVASLIFHTSEELRKDSNFRTGSKVVAFVTQGFYLYFIYMFLTNGRFPPIMIFNIKFFPFVVSTNLAAGTLLALLFRLEAKKPEVVYMMPYAPDQAMLKKPATGMV
ncbi:unnamed protein product [Moneuplotes crassus]|uniref:Uncharacterized protein n=2 Tax=Euplotes crassus TaxID=5936 RepID=A0AAD1Y1K8_EUPCR|nr:unnamed protein product [Moneuplotes crassus]